MLTLVLGGASSGKSAYAEALATQTDEHPIYLATMGRVDSESLRRIERHRLARMGLGFETVEREVDLAGLDLPANRTVLLECLSNLLANELYSTQGAGEPGAESAILEALEHLCGDGRSVVVVSSEVFLDGIPYDQSTQSYVTILGSLHRSIVRRADVFVEVVCGIPVVWKGEPIR